MTFTKPAVTIDLDEYNELLKIKKEKEEESDANGKIPDEDLSDIICEIIENQRNFNRNGFHLKGYDVRVVSDQVSSYGQRFEIRKIKTK